MHAQQPEVSTATAEAGPEPVATTAKPGAVHTSLARRTDRGDGGAGDSLLGLFESLLSPVALLLSLYVLAELLDNGVSAAYIILGVVTFALSYPSKPRLQMNLLPLMLDIALNWLWVVSLLLLCAVVTNYEQMFARAALWHWLWAAPATELAGHCLIRFLSPTLLAMQGPRERALIVGMNEQGLSLAERVRRSPYSRLDLVGFVDSRAADRIKPPHNLPLLGGMGELAAIVKQQRVQQIFLSLPMASQPRILQVLDDLKDTTASISFVPDMFVTDLIQGQARSAYGMPVIAVCDTPFRAGNGFIKRASDIVFSVLILLLISPVLLAVALGVKFTSPGPIIFKQRRYGLDGEEILVYKFRSMTVTEDGASIQQAKKGDQRITPLGAFLRKTSLDELPQFFNVLQGRMSIVGPRPHAVAHNEMYRKLIKGYMVRHKVKPGITGWAQVNGYRGETETLDKMKARIDYDLDYLRNWSLKLDVLIILKTVRLVLKDQSAY